MTGADGSDDEDGSPNMVVPAVLSEMVVEIWCGQQYGASPWVDCPLGENLLSHVLDAMVWR